MLTSTPPSFPDYSKRFEKMVQAADPDIVLVSPAALPVDVQSQLILSEIGGTELIQIERHDTVNGQRVLYQPVVDMNEFSSNHRIPTGQTLAGFKNSFSIDLDRFVPESGGMFFDEQSEQVIVALTNDDGSHIVDISYTDIAENEWFDRKFSVDGGAYHSDGSGYDETVDGGDALGYNIDMSVNGGTAE